MDGRPVVISGGRRLEALRALGAENAPCLCPDIPFLGLLSITDNLERGFNPGELALALSLAGSLEDPKEREAVMEALGLSPSDKRLPGLRAAMSLPEEGFLALCSGRLDPEDAEALSSLPGPERGPSLELILAAKASRRNRRRWLEWISDLARIRERAEAGNGPRESAGPQSRSRPITPRIVTPELLEAASRPDGERLAAERLQALRFPSITAAKERRRALVKSLGLKDGLRLELDPELESKGAALWMSFDSPGGLRRLLKAALDLSESSELGLLLADPEEWPPK
jgi:ParB-like chromosome segregation protein Spo0J